MADSQHSISAPSATPTPPSITDLRINDWSPFWSPEDCATSNLEEAHAVLTVMAAVFRGDGEAIKDMNPAILAATFDGVASLIGLGLHHRAVSQFEERRHD